MKDEDKIYGLIVQAEELQEQTKNFISQAQTVLDEISSQAKKPLMQATKELNQSIKKIDGEFLKSGLKSIFLIGLGIVAIFLSCVFSFQWIFKGYMADLENIKNKISVQEEILAKIKSETWNIRFIDYSDGGRGILLPKGTNVHRTAKDKNGQWHIIIEK